MLPLAVDVFGIRHEAQAADREELDRAWQDNGLVFTTKIGRPVEPATSSARSTASALPAAYGRSSSITCGIQLRPCSNLGVPARDAQLILGHSRLAVTQEIYTHEDHQVQHEALTKISHALRDDGLTAP
jgi:hypothetical protein